MTEIIAVFRSRAQAVDCNARMRANNIPARLIATPKKAGVGCGLSVAFPKQLSKYAKRLISSGGYSAFYGYMKIT